MHAFVPFDPLEAKVSRANDAAFNAIRREITNILSSYVGWYDPFCELIQNALDAVDTRRALERAAGTLQDYHPEVRIFIDLDDNSLSVTDNGVGLDKEKFEQFLAPNFSFNKSDKTRGHKGVGATYVAYGFNYMRVSTKTPGYTASGRILNARNWVKSSKIGDNLRLNLTNLRVQTMILMILIVGCRSLLSLMRQHIPKDSTGFALPMPINGRTFFQ